MEKIPYELSVLIPCYNEEVTIGNVVKSFSAALPDAKIYVYDNNSTDKTAETAAAAGAIVRKEHLQGKGNVVRRMFADIEADVYVLVDGDDTYDAASAPMLVDTLVREQFDMVNASRSETGSRAYRKGHRFGNKFFTSLVCSLFGDRFNDILSGYRVFSRRFVKSFPALSSGFEIETELTIHALELRMPVKEIETPYSERLEGSISKLSTFRDGFRILRTIFWMIKEEKPLFFFSIIGAFMALISLMLAIPIFLTYLETGLVPRFPTAILCTGLMITAFLCFFAGLILDGVAHARREQKRMAYLQISSIAQAWRNESNSIPN